MNNYEETTLFPENEAPIPEEILDVLVQNSQSGQYEEITVGEEILPVDIPTVIECDYREDTVGELTFEEEKEYERIVKNVER